MRDGCRKGLTPHPPGHLETAARNQISYQFPLVTVKEIRTVLDMHGDAPAMTIVPARDEQGSNCVALSPPTAAPLRFGANSYFPHLDTARKLGLELHTPKLPGIGLDIDTPEDLKELCRQRTRTRSQKYLRDQGIVARLGMLSSAWPKIR